jgi:hypothetical protein
MQKFEVIAAQKIVFFTLVFMKTSNPTYFFAIGFPILI